MKLRVLSLGILALSCTNTYPMMPTNIGQRSLGLYRAAPTTTMTLPQQASLFNLTSRRPFTSTAFNQPQKSTSLIQSPQIPSSEQKRGFWGRRKVTDTNSGAFAYGAGFGAGAVAVGTGVGLYTYGESKRKEARRDKIKSKIFKDIQKEFPGAAPMLMESHFEKGVREKGLSPEQAFSETLSAFFQPRIEETRSIAAKKIRKIKKDSSLNPDAKRSEILRIVNVRDDKLDVLYKAKNKYLRRYAQA